MHLAVSVHLFVCSSVNTLLIEMFYWGLSFTKCSKEQQAPLTVQGVCLCVSNRWAYSDNHKDAVDQLLTIH